MALECAGEKSSSVVGAVALYDHRDWTKIPTFMMSTSKANHALKHLNLAFNKLTCIEGLIDNLRGLEFLDVSHNRLTTIGKVKTVSSLSVLRMHGNRLGVTTLRKTSSATTGTSESAPPILEPLGLLPSLKELWLGQNHIHNASEILRLRKLTGLEILQLAPNEACDLLDHYRDIVLSILPTLRFLDQKRVEPEEVSAASTYVESVDGQCFLHRLRAEERRTDIMVARLRPRTGPTFPTPGSRDAYDRSGIITHCDLKQSTRSAKPRKHESSVLSGYRAGIPPSSIPGIRPVAEDATFADVVSALDIVKDQKARPAKAKKKRYSHRTTRVKCPKDSSRQVDAEVVLTVDPANVWKEKEPWSSAPASFETILLSYPPAFEGSVAVCAPGGVDGSVVVRWPRGTVAIATDGGCIRAFHDTGELAVSCDSAGNASVNDDSGRTLVCLCSDGSGFMTCENGSTFRKWNNLASANVPKIIELTMTGKPHRSVPHPKAASNGEVQRGHAALGVSIHVNPCFARIFFDCCGIKCCVAQHGGATILKPDVDLFGRSQSVKTLARERAQTSQAKMEAMPVQQPNKVIDNALRAHEDLIAKIRSATAALP